MSFSTVCWYSDGNVKFTDQLSAVRVLMGLQTQSLGQSEAADHTILMVNCTDFKKVLSKEKVAPRF
jgi:hypothetical protein